MQKYWKFTKDNFCSILLAVLVAGIIINAVIGGIGLIVTQHMIDETYRIHK